MLEKSNLKPLFVLVLAIGFIFLAQGLIWAWNSPTAVPPSDNINTPLNTTNVSQYKIGDLQIGGLFRVYTNAIFDGILGVGVSNPQVKVEVDGLVKISDSSRQAAGLIKYIPDSKEFCGYNGAEWKSLTGKNDCYTYEWRTSLGACNCNTGVQPQSVWCERIEDGANMGGACDVYPGCECSTKPPTSLSCATHECSGGAQKCEGGRIYTCGNCDGDPCNDWCAGAVCDYGCAADGINCAYCVPNQPFGCQNFSPGRAFVCNSSGTGVNVVDCDQFCILFPQYCTGTDKCTSGPDPTTNTQCSSFPH